MGIDLIGCDPLAHLGVIASTLLRAREPTRYLILAKSRSSPRPFRRCEVGSRTQAIDSQRV